MSSHKKGARAVKIPIADLCWSNADSLDWATDEANAGREPPQQVDDVSAKPNGPRRHGYQAGALPTNFREDAVVVPSSAVPLDMTPPFVAYVGNVAHGVNCDVVTAAFTGVINTRVVRTEQATFAYVEFASVEDLQRGVLAHGKYLAGRRMKIDVATDAQRKRYAKERRQNEARGIGLGSSVSSLSRASSEVATMSDMSGSDSVPMTPTSAQGCDLSVLRSPGARSVDSQPSIRTRGRQNERSRHSIDLSHLRQGPQLAQPSPQ